MTPLWNPTYLPMQRVGIVKTTDRMAVTTSRLLASGPRIHLSKPETQMRRWSLETFPQW